MTREMRADAFALLGEFLREDAHYLDSSGAYGDGGAEALERALNLFIERPETGFVWLAYADGPAGREAVAVCVVCFAISTSAGALVAKLDDVAVRAGWQSRGVGSAHLAQLAEELRRLGVKRIDTAVHQRNRDARRFYERHGFLPLGEERIALLL
jgi:GNAT superfamily N-acetyltransferase